MQVRPGAGVVISPTTVRPALADQAVHVRPRWLPLVRVGWIVFMVICAWFWVVQNLPVDLSYLDEASPGMARGDVLRVGLRQLGMSPWLLAWVYAGAAAAQAVCCFALALLLFWHRSDELMALFVGVILVASACGTYPPDLVILAESHPVRAFIGAAITFTFASGFFLLFLLFPDGRIVPRWTVVPALLIVGVNIYTFFPTPVRSTSGGGLGDALYLLTVLTTSIYAQVYRYRRVSGPVAREQTKWFVVGLGVAMAGFIALNILLAFAQLDRPDFPPRLAVIVTLLFPLLFVGLFICAAGSLVVAVLRYHLFDIDLVINRALVYGALTACVVAFYVLIVGGVGTLLQAGDNAAIAFLATGIVAVVFQPLRSRLQRGVNRLLYGQRDDPYAVLTGIGRRLEGTLAPDAILPEIVATVTETLHLPYAAIALRQRQGSTSDIAAAAGIPSPATVAFPLTYQGTQVGELHVAPRAGEELGAVDRRLLEDLARQAGVAVHAVRLTSDLQRSRERIVTAREDERRRLRRDLHDGLGPRLAGLTLRIETARDRLAHDSAADDLLDDLSARMEEAVADIRRLVYGLRPPALDDLGLVGAIRQTVGCYDAAGIDVVVDAPESLPPLPAATEVAAFRIAQEAITNIVRHAAARRCAVAIAMNEASRTLTVVVEDDGRGLDPERRNGVGLRSMRERAEELGGTLVIESRSGAGTRVQAKLPCHWDDGGAES